MKPIPRPSVVFQRVARLRPGATRAVRLRGLTIPVTQADEVVPDVLEIWVEQPLDAQWIAAFRLVRRGGGSDRFRVGEMRIFPAEPGRRSFGDWSGAWQGLDAEAPRRGLTAQLVRRAQPHQWLRMTEQIVPLFRRLFPQAFPAAPPSPPLAARGKRRGRPPRADEDLLEVAKLYAQASATSRRPVEDVAQQLGEPVARVRGWIHKARLRGFLSQGAQGHLGGRLTATATFLLEKEKQSTPNTRRRLRRATKREAS